MPSSQSSSSDSKGVSGLNKFFQLFAPGDSVSNRKILDDKVLNQRDVADAPERDTLADAQASSHKDEGRDVWGQIVGLMFGGVESGSKTIQNIVSSADQSSGELSNTESTIKPMEMKDELQRIMKQMEGSFGDVPLDKIDPAAFMYYLEAEDAKKNPSWKRRLHRFMPAIKMETVYGLHDALYLAQLAYVDTVEDIQKGLKEYQGANFELVFCTTEAKPRMPAYFLAIKKEGISPASKTNAPNYQKSKVDDYVELILSVRGTKTLEDMLSDALLEERDYRGGKSHDGVCQSGLYVVQQTKALLLHILDMSGRKKLKLTLLGHSLGAGAAAIACIELNDEPNIDASCIGFGCPALLTKEMSEQWKDKIITIVSDADCVSRMSGATVANMLMNVLEFDYSEYAMRDVHQMVNMISDNASYLLPEEKKQDVIAWFQEQLKKNNKSLPTGSLPRREIVLYPPGKCIHFYRDGVGISTVEVPCTIFNELDVARSMVDDHLVPTGYNPILTETMRSHLKQSRFQFKNDVMAIRDEPVEAVATKK